MDPRRLYWWTVGHLRPKRRRPVTWIKWPAWIAFNAGVVCAVVLFRRGRFFPEPRRDSWVHKWQWRFEYLFDLTEYQTVDVCRRVIKPGMRVIDLGAHVGYYTRLFARLVGPDGFIYALEAHPENYRFLNRNRGIDGLEHVLMDQFLIGSVDGVGHLYIGSGHSNHTVHPGYAQDGDSMEIPAARLDTLLKQRQIGAFDFIKIDCEGAEPSILEGASDTLRSVSGLLVEINPRALAAGGSSSRALLDQIRTLGFSPRAIEDDGALAEPDPFRPDTFNVIALRA
jgi:FkbM family methyltransferase